MDDHQQEEVREGTEQSILLYYRKDFGTTRLPQFAFGRWLSKFYIRSRKCDDSWRQDYPNFNEYHIQLHHRDTDIGDDIFSKETAYKLSVIDSCGLELATAQGTVQKHYTPIGLVFCMHNLKATFKIRLSWHGANEKKDAQTPGSVLTEEKDETRFFRKLSKDLEVFYENKTNTDCILRLDNAEFSVHRAVLTARSPVFSAMFLHDTLESRSGVVDISSTIMSDVLHYLYSGHIRGLTSSTAFPMYAVADKYSLVELKKESMDFLMCNLTMENLSDAAVLANTHTEKDLEDKVIQFIEGNSEELEENEKWESFSKSQPLLAYKFIYSAL